MFKVKEIMSTNLVTIRDDGSIYDAVKELVANDITGLPVVDADGKLVGVISEKDMLRLLYNLEDSGGKVRDYMTEEPVSFSPDESLVDVAECFINNHFRRVPIVQDGKLVGIISRRDIVAYILKLRRGD